MEVKLRKRRLVLLLMFYLLIATTGARGAMGGQARAVDLLFSLLIAVVVTLTCIVDAHIARKPMVHAAQWLMLFTWPVSVPCYLIWSRGLRGILVLLLHLGLLLATCILVSILLTTLGLVPQVPNT